MLFITARWWKHLLARRGTDRMQRRGFRPRHVFSTVAAECVEARALLSNIAVTVNAGVITLAGDTGDHSFTADVVTISSVQNLELTGTSGTEFTFGSTTAATIDIPLS